MYLVLGLISTDIFLRKSVHTDLLPFNCDYMDKSSAFLTRWTLLTVLFLSFLLSSCAHSPTTTSSQIVSPAKQVNVVADAQNEPTETDAILDKELETLMSTGQWGSMTSEIPMLQQSIDLKLYDFPIVLNTQVLAYLNLFQTAQREMFERWLSRSTKYLAIMKEELKRAGLPQDLAYLSMIESGFSPKAFSSAQAVGLWQFMNDTGRQYALRIDDTVDERRHIEKSTRAAVAFLGDLYRDFGDWHLAVAAYNGGPARVQIGLERFGVRSFWDLAKEQYLPLETKRYVPKLIAAIIIAKEPEKYGFTNIAYERSHDYESLSVGPNLNLDAIALVCDSDIQTIKNLNLELCKGKTPANVSRYTVKIPASTKEVAARNLPRLQQVSTTNYHTHVVGRRDTLASVCDQYGISTTTLLKTNKLRSQKLIPGKILQIPYEVVSYKLSSSSESKEAVAALPKANINPIPAVPERNAIAASASTSAPAASLKHTVKSGETLFSIAKRYNVSLDSLKQINNLPKNGSVAKGQQIIVKTTAGTTDRPAAQTAPIDTKNNQKITATPTSKIQHSTAIEHPQKSVATTSDGKDKKASSNSWYVVKHGDSLSTIAQKFNTSPNQIKMLNNLRTSMVTPGIRLKVKDA